MLVADLRGYLRIQHQRNVNRYLFLIFVLDEISVSCQSFNATLAPPLLLLIIPSGEHWQYDEVWPRRLWRGRACSVPSLLASSRLALCVLGPSVSQQESWGNMLV